MKNLVEFKTRVYKTNELNNYMKDSLEDPQEGDEWKKELMDQKAMLPSTFLSRVYIDPDDIIMYMESFSLAAMEENPENPVLDTVDICLSGIGDISIASTIEEFQKKIKAHYKSLKIDA